MNVAHAAALIREGKLVAFPTETVYGLGANAFDAAAVRRIFIAKSRPASSPLIVHVDGIAMARSLAAEWPASAETLAQRCWPGPLTLIVTKHASIPDEVTAGLPTVGLRMPAHPVALELIRAAGVPIAAPSANKFTELSPTTAEHVHQSLGDAVDYILDGGPTTVGIESTVVSLVDEEPLLLRPGMISQTEIEATLGRPMRVAAAPVPGPHQSPGQHDRHYRPKTPLYLGHAPSEGRGAWLRIAGHTPATFAATLYESLHQLDAQDFDWIAVETPPTTAEWAGVLDRLQRAASR